MRTFFKLAFSARMRVKDISFDTKIELGNSLLVYNKPEGWETITFYIISDE